MAAAGGGRGGGGANLAPAGAQVIESQYAGDGLVVITFAAAITPAPAPAAAVVARPRLTG
ncbi:MAG: hypothetical protein ACRDY6_01300 [Acidimicrobiia bacterium]